MCTLQEIKDCIVFEGCIKDALELMVDSWFKMAKQEGMSEQDALRLTLDKLAERLVKIEKNAKT